MSNQEPLVFDLHDIFEDVVFDGYCVPKNDCHVLRSNIKYILKREKLWKNDFTIVFPMGSLKKIDVAVSFYQYDFSIYSETCGEYIAHGTCFGSGRFYSTKIKSKSVFEILDLQLDIQEYDLNRLRGKIKKELVVFT